MAHTNTRAAPRAAALSYRQAIRLKTRHAHSTRSRSASPPRLMAPSKLVKKARKDARKDSAAAHQLALWYSLGEEGLRQDLALWLRWEVEAAERGCAEAQFDLGDAYDDGTMGLQVDHATAFAWFRKAALQGRALLH